ncbi:MAG: adenylate/guanylate cyclase domain-containing protein [Acidimicrobiales bacterium]|nr:adenylate/guanylate cyclase domain-containing protein [Acidimicrobiales bacterium]
MAGSGGGPPSGVVTLLFTDVEGSTRWWAADPEAMSASLRVHDGILREAVGAGGGYVFATAGDSFAVAFSRASDAYDAARAAQEALATARWPGPELRVRMGLHLGEAEERGGDYFGPVVNAAARVEAAGHGGQILCTDAVAAVVDDDRLVDLGEHQLRDLPAPLRLWQVGATEFPPLRGVVRDRDTLPVRRTRLLGRDREVADVRVQVVEHRLVTLVGPGGIGKTSLAVEVAGQLGAHFEGGVHFADLAAVGDPDGILPAFCRAVQLVVTSSPYDQLCSHLAAQPTLVVVDNCEHLIDDVAELVDRLVDDVPTLHLLATSREHLDIDGEHLVPVGPLATTADAPAVRLFVERVVALAPGFAPTEDDLATIAAICTRLDGLPLAIELAAGRALTMGLADIEQGLGDRFALLAGSRRGKLRRQQSLRAAIDWSIDLLADDERGLLARLAVISGPFALEIAAAVGELSSAAAADGVSSLVAKSLLSRADDVGGEARFVVLETVREWGLEHLSHRGELGTARNVHAQWYLSQVEALDPVTWLFSAADLGPLRSPVDPFAAAAHLAQTDPAGAATIVASYHQTITVAGLGPPAREIQRAARDTGRGRTSARLWWGEQALALSLMEGIDIDDPPPPDDGSWEWRLLVGGPGHENAGNLGWLRSWAEPRGVIDDFEALSPVADDAEALALRAFATTVAVHAYTHLGHADEAIAAYEEAGRLWQAYGVGRASLGTVLMAVATAAVLADTDLRSSPTVAATMTPAGDPTARTTWSLDALTRAVLLCAPGDRPTAVARAAREHCHGRYPDEESAYLAVLAYHASAEDPERALGLVEDIAYRTPGVPVLDRMVRLRAAGSSLDALADERQHVAAVARKFESDTTREERFAVNRPKLDAEVARVLDRAG